MRSTILPLLPLALLALAPPGAAEAPAEPPGARVFQESCADCHKGKSSLDATRLTRAKWKEAVDRMIETGLVDPAPPKAKLEQLLDWLAKTKGPVDAAPEAGRK